MKQDRTHDKTIVLQTFPDLVGAQIMQHKLMEKGIRSFLKDENTLGIDPVSGVELSIFEKDKEEALEMINSLSRNP
jgi:phosphoribosylanthranilate isomerase